jgi:hypothetical protein
LVNSLNSNECAPLIGFVVNKKEKSIFQWMEWIVMHDQPLSKIDYELTRKLSKGKAVSSKSMRTYILTVTQSVENLIAAELPAKFAILFDG